MDEHSDGKAMDMRNRGRSGKPRTTPDLAPAAGRLALRRRFSDRTYSGAISIVISEESEPGHSTSLAVGVMPLTRGSTTKAPFWL